jgi:protein-S-isoprenylcysteine O-methyltransferase Ste14
MNSADRQSKVVPAPLLVLFCLGAGWLAHYLHPLRLLPDLGVAGPLIGAAICTIGLAVGLSGVREFHRHSTPTSPFKPTTALVTSGVFRLTRNPMYLGFVLLTVGVAVAFNSIAFLLAAVLIGGLIQVAVITPEERFLSSRYGSVFEQYRRKTRRWL